MDQMTDDQWLEGFLAQWHLLADLSFSDLVLWKPLSEEGDVFACTAQIRPVTGPTALEEDIVGELIEYEPDHQVTVAYMSHAIAETSDNALNAGIPVDVWAIPVLRHVALHTCHNKNSIVSTKSIRQIKFGIQKRVPANSK